MLQAVGPRRRKNVTVLPLPIPPPLTPQDRRLVFYYNYNRSSRAQRTHSGGLDILHRVVEEISRYIPCIAAHQKSDVAFRPHVDTVVYAETVRGNPLQATRVIRWILFIPDPDVQKTWAPTDRLLGYVDTYAWVSQNLYQRALHTAQSLCWVHVPVVTRPWRRDRQGAWFTIRKGTQAHVRLPHPLPPLPTEYTWRSAEQLSHAALVERLHTAVIFATYDLWTFASLLAPMNGCISLVIPHPEISCKQFHEHWPMAKFGVAYGVEELDWARDTMCFVEGYLRTYFEDNNKEQVKDFVQWLAEWN